MWLILGTVLLYVKKLDFLNAYNKKMGLEFAEVHENQTAEGGKKCFYLYLAQFQILNTEDKTRYFKTNQIRAHEWPSQFPDLNLIKHLQEQVKVK